MKVVANKRNLQGTGASRRLRRAGKVPGIIYGGQVQPAAIEVDHNSLYHALRVESFHSSILEMDLDGSAERVLLRAVQWHPYKQQVMHIDFQRVDADHVITMKVPVHFMNAEVSPAVKLGGAIVSHVLNEIEISCLPANLPEFIEVDLSAVSIGQVIHVSQVPMPEGVKPVLHGREDPVVVTVTKPGGGGDEEAPAAAAEPAKK
ncbi:MAG: 50S ribosomal protein L25/general stress protein Ctc [Quisquiliibacterium sp.]